MRVNARILFLVACVILCDRHLLAATRWQGSTHALPKIDILYPPFGTIFDKTCPSFVVKEDITAELIKAAGELRPRLEAQWSRHGSRYLSTALREIGAPFPYGELQATLTVCSVSTMSTPLMINVRQYLPGALQPAPIDDFSEKLFHELMHHYVSRLAADSRLKKKYASESQIVINHLHVMALEKMVLLKLGETSELKFLDGEYRTDPAPSHYKRAWEIVSDIEGYESFIKELEDAAKRH